ncbi:DUF4255 domain-containing protein, partial [Streptomyces sp. ZEA17I]
GAEVHPGRGALPVYGSRPGRPAREPPGAGPGSGESRARAVSLRITETRGTRGTPEDGRGTAEERRSTKTRGGGSSGRGA